MSSGLGTRLITAGVLAPLVILAIVYLPAPAFAALIAVLMLIGLWEWTRLAGILEPAPRGAILVAQAVLLLALWTLPYPRLVPIVAGACGFWLLAALWLRHTGFGADDAPGFRWLKLLAGIIAVTATWAAAVYIRDALPQGAAWLLACLLVVYGSDTLAYFSGRAVGGAKMSPVISPNKTWAGFFGAVLGTIPIALAVGWLFGLRGAPLLAWMLLAMIAVQAGIVGDLFESLLKRHRRMKDSGRLFPGHGGLLDRADSLLAALPLFAAGLSWLVA